MPEQYIYEPWKAPLEVQRKANCIVGKDYPNRVVIHEEVSKTNMAKMKAAYDARKEGKSIKDVKEKPVSAVSKKRSQSPKTAPITKFFKKGQIAKELNRAPESTFNSDESFRFCIKFSDVIPKNQEMSDES